MATDTKFPRGSEWRKWDLHVHSPTSLLNNQYPKTAAGAPDWERFVNAMERLDISVLGITDYFTIDGYKRLLEFKQAGRLGNITTILPNIEFRLDCVLSSRRDGTTPRRLNLHVIFSNEVSPQDIEEHFLHDLDFYYEASPQSRDEKRKLKVSNIEALGQRLREEHAAFRSLSPREVGAMNAVVSHESISNILSGDARFRGKYLIVFPEELYNLISWDGQDHIIRKVVLQKSDMVLSANPKTRQWCLGLPPYGDGAEKYREEFKSLKPCIHGCDAHKLEDLGRPCACRGEPGHSCGEEPGSCELRYCWIKGDPTFEGLKQILYEPVDRVRIQEADPSPVKSNYCVDEARIEGCVINAELSISATTLPLNGELVAVAGGKGSGKTALVDLIANCYMDRRQSGDPNSFVLRVIEESPDLQIALTFRDGSEFSKKLEEPQFVAESEVVYIAQGELERYIGDKSDLDRYIRELVFGSPQVKNTVKAFEFQKLRALRKELGQKLAEKHRAIHELEQATLPQVVEELKAQKSQLDGEVKDVGARIRKLEKRLSKKTVEETQRRQEGIAQLQERRDNLVEALEDIRAASEFLTDQLPEFNERVNRINEKLKAVKLEGSLRPLVYPDARGLQSVAAAAEDALERTLEDIESAEKALKTFETGVQEHAQYLGHRKDLEAQVRKVEQRLAGIEASRKTLQALQEERKRIFTDLIQTVIRQKTKYDEIIATFAQEKDKVLSDLDFVAELRLNIGALITLAEEILDNRQVVVDLEDERGTVFKALLGHYQEVTKGNLGRVADLVSETESLRLGLRGKLKRSRTVDSQALDKCLYDCYLEVVPVVTYKRTGLDRLSLGQKATVLIKIYLAQGTNPIIIDSHDDHLDNEFIMEELVGAIRQAKEYRQIILVSNNGNVVINSDAEQLVIASRESGTISYTSGSIEESTIRERALKVLEGGVDAFRKRQQKYRIPQQA